MTTTEGPNLVVAARFCGPTGSGNGGYVAGRVADFVGTDGPVEVTLREPPPLDVDLDVRPADGNRTTLGFGGAVIAEARPAELAGHLVDPVDQDTARAAMGRYTGAESHPFPECFVCGPDRPAPDGLGLRPGRLPDRDGTQVATVWTPDAEFAGDDGLVPAYLVWAALDCPGFWCGDPARQPMVLGRITAAVDVRPRAGDPCVVVARLLGEEGRKTFAATTAYDADGRVLGRAEQVWITLRTHPR